jgi:hypothetical protein
MRMLLMVLRSDVADDEIELMSFLHASNFEEQSTVSRNFQHSEVEKEHFYIIAYRHSHLQHKIHCLSKSLRDHKLRL